VSRVGNKEIAVPAAVKVTISGESISVEGPLGKLFTKVLKGVQVTQEGQILRVVAPKPVRGNGGYQGTMRAVLANMVHGVTEGYEGVVEISGVGYKAELKQADLVRFNLGFTEPRDVKCPAGIKVAVDKAQTSVTVKGADRQVVFQVLALMRSLKKAEPYKGKGVKYKGEIIRRKAGKAGAK